MSILDFHETFSTHTNNNTEITEYYHGGDPSFTPPFGNNRNEHTFIIREAHLDRLRIYDFDNARRLTNQYDEHGNEIIKDFGTDDRAREWHQKKNGNLTPYATCMTR